MSEASSATLKLKKQEERRLRAGHLWVYSNEVDVKATPLGGFESGQLVRVVDHHERFLGQAYINPNTLICARLYSQQPRQLLDSAFFLQGIRRALALRRAAFDQPFYRLVYGESDGLPGLVVDRFNSVLVVQITTAGMEKCQEAILTALDEILKPEAIVLRNDSSARELEGLECYTHVVKGVVAEQVEVVENNTSFLAPLSTGQKTGWYYDHRLNRQRLQQYVKGKRVLDVFSYIGAWGVQALQAGADELFCVDASETYLDLAHDNAALNQRGDAITTLAGDAFEILRELRTVEQRFDVVIVDPPAFIKRRKDIKEGTLAYRRINRLAMQLLKADGLLLSASCSFHMRRDKLLDSVRLAANKLDTTLQVLEQGHQGADHPVHPAMVETDYLKAYLCRVQGRQV